MPFQSKAGRLLDFQVVPEFVEVHTFPPVKVTANLVPSADEAMLEKEADDELKAAAWFEIQVKPELVEVKMQDGAISAANLVPSVEEATEHPNPFGVIFKLRTLLQVPPESGEA